MVTQQSKNVNNLPEKRTSQ